MLYEKITKKGRSTVGNYSTITEILDVDKDHLISILTEEPPVLRAKIGLSQDELSNIVGISRQTYSAIETNNNERNVLEYISLVIIGIWI